MWVRIEWVCIPHQYLWQVLQTSRSLKHGSCSSDKLIDWSRDVLVKRGGEIEDQDWMEWDKEKEISCLLKWKEEMKFMMMQFKMMQSRIISPSFYFLSFFLKDKTRDKLLFASLSRSRSTKSCRLNQTRLRQSFLGFPQDLKDKKEGSIETNTPCDLISSPMQDPRSINEGNSTASFLVRRRETAVSTTSSAGGPLVFNPSDDDFELRWDWRESGGERRTDRVKETEEHEEEDDDDDFFFWLHVHDMIIVINLVEWSVTLFGLYTLSVASLYFFLPPFLFFGKKKEEPR